MQLCNRKTLLPNEQWGHSDQWEVGTLILFSLADDNHLNIST